MKTANSIIYENEKKFYLYNVGAAFKGIVTWGVTSRVDVQVCQRPRRALRIVGLMLTRAYHAAAELAEEQREFDKRFSFQPEGNSHESS